MNDHWDVKVLDASYQRNGISGEGFVAVLIECEGETLIATIGYDEKDKLDPITCRVINPLQLQKKYRGDSFGHRLKKQARKIQSCVDQAWLRMTKKVSAF